MTIRVLMYGKTSESYAASGIAAYLLRLKHYCKIEWNEIPVKKSQAQGEKIQANEALMNLKLISKNDFVILLDEQGKQYSSEEFAGWIEKHITGTSKDLIFLIGGAYGFHDSIYKRADAKISLSKMTFTHQMVRLIFAEQLYRAFTIIRNEKYHH